MPSVLPFEIVKYMSYFVIQSNYEQVIKNGFMNLTIFNFIVYLSVSVFLFGQRPQRGR